MSSYVVWRAGCVILVATSMTFWRPDRSDEGRLFVLVWRSVASIHLLWLPRDPSNRRVPLSELPLTGAFVTFGVTCFAPRDIGILPGLWSILRGLAFFKPMNRSNIIGIGLLMETLGIPHDTHRRVEPRSL